MKNYLIYSSAVIGLISSACGGEDTEPPPVMMMEQPLCERGALEADLISFGPLAGPAVDPATGALRDPPAEGWVVSSTYLRLRPEPAAQMRFGELSQPIQQALATQPGLLAIEVASSMSCGTARTFTVWESEEAMYEFVVGPAHAAARAAVGEVSRGGSLVTHWTATRLDQTNWAEAARRLAADDGPLY